STYLRLRASRTTDAMPLRCSRCDNSRPAGPAPTMPTCVRIPALLRGQRAAGLPERPERRFLRDLAHDLVVIPRVLALGRACHLVERQVVEDAAVGADAARAPEIVDRQLAHLARDDGRVLGPGRVDGLEIVGDRRIGGGLLLGWHAADLGEEALRPG